MAAEKRNLAVLIQTVANVGVVLGIVFLAVEVRQNQQELVRQNTLTELTVRDSQNEANSRFRNMLLQNPDVHEILIKANTDTPLSDFERARFTTVCYELLYMNLTAFTRAEALGFPNGERAGVFSSVSSVAASEEFRACWASWSRTQRANGYDLFVDEVEAGLQAVAATERDESN